jgi:hyaluronan synthase
MLIRWERGNVREALRLIRLMLGRWNLAERWWACLDVLLDVASWPAFMGLVCLAHLKDNPRFFATMALVTLLLALNCLRTKKSLDLLYYIAYAFFQMVALSWLFPYSLLTVRNGRWLTR